jgi:hypothetical protein
MPVKIDWEGLIVAFESRSHQITHFFDRETGDVEQVLERDAARHAQMSGDPRYVALPRDSGERSRGDLEQFLGHCEDADCRRDLAAALSGPQPASEFRQVLLRYPTEEAHFFQFKEKQAFERARRWLADLGFSVGRPPAGM